MELIQEGVKNLPLANHKLILLPEKALYFEQKQTLILADTHFGKTGHFRKSGIPIPEGADDSNYQGLDRLLENYPVKVVYILGDLFHSQKNSEWKTFARWIKRYPNLSFCLVQGNHDILPSENYQDVGLHLYPEPVCLGPFLLSHKPLNTWEEDFINLAGHIHPGVHMSGKGRQSMKLPCFYLSDKQMILPAFGRFTGTSPVKPVEGDRIFPIADNQVFEG